MLREAHVLAIRGLVGPLAATETNSFRPTHVSWRDIRVELDAILAECEETKTRTSNKDSYEVAVVLDRTLPLRKKAAGKKRKRGRKSVSDPDGAFSPESSS